MGRFIISFKYLYFYVITLNNKLMENPMIEGNKRPEFLTTICVLTFIGSSFSILGGIVSLFMSNPVVVEAMETAMENSGQEMPEMFSKTFEHAASIGAISIVLSIMSLVGAIMMFKLNRTGFYLYTIAQVAMLFVSPIFLGFEAFSKWGLIFTTGFIVMYAVNLKHMNKSECAACGSVEE